MRKIGAVGVIIPARDESGTVGLCVSTVRKALSAEPLMRSWIVVVADGCRDATAAKARAALGDTGEVLVSDAKGPGLSRRRGAAELRQRWLNLHPDEIWLANTDADSTVPPDWITRQLLHASQGICALAGIVDIKTDDAELASAFRRHYRIEENGSHAHVHGANLGVRLDAYLDAGGWPAVAVGEDRVLWETLGSKGWARQSTSASPVTTSARLCGRARGGFADVLLDLQPGGCLNVGT
jgi:glycosyltransferase involved in cell wall biosynthesis